MAFTLWPYTIRDEDLTRPPQRGEYVFAGGNSLRDYGPLLEAARQLTATVTIATSILIPDQLEDLPPNVTITGLVAQERFDELMLGAGIVVVPIEPRSDRGAGYTSYTNAMFYGKPMVVTDVPGVHDYVTHGETGLIVPPGDAAAMSAAVRQLLEDPAEADRMAARRPTWAGAPVDIKLSRCVLLRTER